jgi:outer membrane protein
MKRMQFFTLSLCLGAAIGAHGQATTAARPAGTAAGSAAPAKVAVIEFQAAVAQTNEFQRNLADLQKKYDLTKELQDQGAQLSDAERANRARTLDEKKKQLDRDTQDAQGDFQGDMQQMINTVAAKVGAVMTDYAKEKGFTLVLDASDQQNATVLYAVPNTDITKTIVDAYNVKSGIPAPAASGAPAVDAPQPQAAPAH